MLFSGSASALYILSFDQYSLLYYGDSISHLVASRKLVDWVNPGVSQIGTVWLPMLHFLLIPFSLNDFLFTTGLAGTMLSLPSLALATFYVVKIVRRWHGSDKLANLAGILFALNPSVIYMGLVSMQESLFLLFTLSSIYCLYIWYDERSKYPPQSLKYLSICALLVIMATLTRYEGWLLPIPLLILAIARMSFSTTFNQRAFILFHAVASFGGIALWLLWNSVMFGDAFAFANIPFYSYLAQATSRPFRENLLLQPLSSAQVFFTAMEVMYGAPMLMISLIGLLVFVAGKYHIERLGFLVLLGLPTITTYVSLVLGFGELFHQGGGIWFNSRFLVLASGIIAFGGISLLRIAKRRNLLIFLVIILVSSASFGSIRQLGYPNPPMVMKEAYTGFSYRNETSSAIEIAKFLSSNYDSGSILTLTSSGDAHKIMVFSGIHLRNFRDLFAGDPWPVKDGVQSLNEWVVISNKPSGDAVLGVKFLESRSVLLNEKYEIARHNEFFTLMRLARH